jgi:hypothetical protein
MDAAVMARPKKTSKAMLPDRTIAFRVSGEYGVWVDQLASHNRSTVAGLLDQALARFAKEIGFEERPPER